MTTKMKWRSQVVDLMDAGLDTVPDWGVEDLPYVQDVTGMQEDNRPAAIVVHRESVLGTKWDFSDLIERGWGVLSEPTQRCVTIESVPSFDPNHQPPASAA